MSDLDYPRLLYKLATPADEDPHVFVPGGPGFKYVTVTDAASEEVLAGEGWYRTSAEAELAEVLETVAPATPIPPRRPGRPPRVALDPPHAEA